MPHAEYTVGAIDMLPPVLELSCQPKTVNVSPEVNS